MQIYLHSLLIIDSIFKIELIFCKKTKLTLVLESSLFAEIKKLKSFFDLKGLYKPTCQSYKLITTMSTTMINESVSFFILDMMTKQTQEIVKALADKHGFDLEEALEMTLPKGVVKKEVIPRKSSPKSLAKSIKDKSKDQPKEKKAKTGYLLFSDAMRAQVREALEAKVEDGTKVMASKVVSELAAKWGELTVEQKAEWKEIAEAAKSTPPSDDEEAVSD